MKHFILAIFSILLVSLNFAQTSVKVSGQFLNAPSDSVYIAKFTGKGYINYQGTKADKQGKFTIKTTVPAPDYYVIRVGNLHANIILRDSSDIKVYGDKKNLKSPADAGLFHGAGGGATSRTGGHTTSATLRGTPIGAEACPLLTASMSCSFGYLPKSQ